MGQMFDEVPGYAPGFWKTIAVHNEKAIKGFFGEYRWLSNFYESPVWFRGLQFPSSENAFQSAKVQAPFRGEFLGISPAESKKRWKSLPKQYSAEEWDAIKYAVMAEAVFSKFTVPDLQKKLLAFPADIFLEETNWWGDAYWGVDIVKGGQNNLGILLMKLRKFWE